ncbi:MAG: HTH domain-containing protein [Nanoarchaeota archaeon]|nr:HTH domain-containing protein [Nanoarchaeota archaeon]
MDISALEKLGLNENEIKIYLALLKEGLSTGGKLAEKTNIHRRTAYDTLNSLSEKGLVTSIIKEKIKYFEAIDPKHFLDIVKDQEQSIKTILPELELLKKQVTNKAEAQIYQGIKSIKKIYEDILNHKEYSVLGAGTPLREMLGPFFINFQKRKKSKKIKSRVLVAEKYKNEEVSTKTFGQVKFLKEYEAPTTTYIYGNKVAIILSEPILGILIENKDVNKSFLNYFNLMWKGKK